MKNKLWTIYSVSNLPDMPGEVFTQPSLTDELACEPLQHVVERFLQAPYVPGNEHYDVESNSVDDVEKAFNDGACEDISHFDTVERLDILATAQRLVEQLRKSNPEPKVSKKAEDNVQAPKVVQDVVQEPKSAN